MAALSFRDGVGIAQIEKPLKAGRETRLALRLGDSELGSLVEALEEVFERDGGELRLDLPQEWIIFWKEREPESRFLIAHPEVEQWVATVALERDYARRVISALQGLDQGATIELSELGPVGGFSNLELAITRQGRA